MPSNPIKISYAQNNEDIMLFRALGSIPNGFFIDVGSGHPITDSTSYLFYRNGWRGLCVEPSASLVAVTREIRPEDVTVEVAASNVNNEDVDFWEVTGEDGSFRGISTLHEHLLTPSFSDNHKPEPNDNTIKNSVERTKVQTRKLKDILAEHFPKKQVVHFCKIDVEGHEKEVIEGIDWNKIRPWVLVVEATLPNTQIPNHEHWEKTLLKNGYVHAYSDGLNRFYVAKEHRELLEHFRVPPNVFDGFQRAQEHNLTERLSDTENQIRETKRSLVESRELLFWLSHEYQNEKDRIAELIEKINDEKDQNHILFTQTKDLEKQLDEVWGSTSWRVTRPVRWVGGLRHRKTKNGIADRSGADDHAEVVMSPAQQEIAEILTAKDKK